MDEVQLGIHLINPILQPLKSLSKLFSQRGHQGIGQFEQELFSELSH